MHTVAHALWGVSKHVAFGYLVYSLVQHGRGRVPAGRTTSALLLGTLFPDLVDKPLTFVGIVGYGRSVAHSLFTVAVVVLVIRHFTQRWNRPEGGIAFSVGYLSHIPVDMYGTLLTGSQSMDTAFLFWPVIVEYSLGVPTPEVPVSRTAVFTFILASACCLWLYDGLPIASDPARAVYRHLRT